MDINILTACINSAVDLARGLIDARDRQVAAAIQVDPTEKLIQAQAQLFEVSKAIADKDAALHALLQRNRELEAAERDKGRYQLAKLGVAGDFFAYQLRPPAELLERQDELPHFVCQPCFDLGKLQIRLVKSQAVSWVVASRTRLSNW
jgi:hypothetical protein